MITRVTSERFPEIEPITPALKKSEVTSLGNLKRVSEHCHRKRSGDGPRSPQNVRQLIETWTYSGISALGKTKSRTAAVRWLMSTQNQASMIEQDRLNAVRRYDILDTPPDGAFNRITAIAARLLGLQIAIVSTVDQDRIWFKSHHGLDLEEVGRDPGLCASCILQEGPWIVKDAIQDIRALANPLVAGEFGLRFYLGIPLRTKDGFNLGTLCVIDFLPRAPTESEIAQLTDLAAVVMDELVN